jgi:protein SMG6
LLLIICLINNGSYLTFKSFSYFSSKQYEVSQRKRDEKNRSKTKEKEQRFDGNFRKETWIHPEGGSRFHRTAPLNPSLVINSTNENDSSNDEELQNMDPSELNKRFVISFLHVQGKLINNIGMESFQTCATQMLKEFRALLHISPIPVNSHRLLQLISMNMYAIANSQIKGKFFSRFLIFQFALVILLVLRRHY